MGKAEENKQKKRTALLSHAFSLFINKGIPNTTISDIVNNAGVAKGTFYSYFKDKDDLIEKLVAQKAEQLLAASIEELEKHTEVDTVEEKIIFIANDLLDRLTLDTRLLKFINKNLSYGFISRALSREDIKSELDIPALYYKMLESDGSKWENPSLMLYTIFELVSSTCHTVILKSEPVNFEEYKPYLFKCIRSIIEVFRVS
ncbi:MAG: TetR/AcrR family transcriptional regulator [Lachnospiraceae bacterium]